MSNPKPEVEQDFMNTYRCTSCGSTIDKEGYSLENERIANHVREARRDFAKEIEERFNKLVIPELTQPEYNGWNNCLEEVKKIMKELSEK